MSNISDVGILNVKTNGTTNESKTPFLIGVSGGTASGKVIQHFAKTFLKDF